MVVGPEPCEIETGIQEHLIKTAGVGYDVSVAFIITRANRIPAPTPAEWIVWGRCPYVFWRSSEHAVTQAGGQHQTKILSRSAVLFHHRHMTVN
ncbi:MAG: hypothetical protein JXA42_24560 [Anaerolineales bacterium]|nr:hypothetical protein [Anaerolineales bacterium]